MGGAAGLEEALEAFAMSLEVVGLEEDGQPSWCDFTATSTAVGKFFPSPQGQMEHEFLPLMSANVPGAQSLHVD